jgi:hypothetical protein
MSLRELSAAALTAVEAAITAVEGLQDAMEPLIEWDVDDNEAEAKAVSVGLDASRGVDLEATLGEADTDLPDPYELECLQALLTDLFYAAEEAEWDEEDPEA